jgi:hypothetical protein
MMDTEKLQKKKVKLPEENIMIRIKHKRAAEENARVSLERYLGQYFKMRTESK